MNQGRTDWPVRILTYALPVGNAATRLGFVRGTATLGAFCSETQQTTNYSRLHSTNNAS